MYEKFGEFDSYEELNKTAEGFLNEGDTNSIKELAVENGIDEMDVEDYLDSIVEELATPYSAALGKLEVEEAELKSNMQDQVEMMPYNIIFTFLKNMCSTEGMSAAIMKKGKRVSDIYDSMRAGAKEHKSGSVGVSCGTDRELCELIQSYYLKSNESFEKKIESLYR